MAVQAPPRGVEGVTETRQKQQSSDPRGAKSGAQPDVAALLRLMAGMSSEQRDALLAVAKQIADSRK